MRPTFAARRRRRWRSSLLPADAAQNRADRCQCVGCLRAFIVKDAKVRIRRGLHGITNTRGATVERGDGILSNRALLACSTQCVFVCLERRIRLIAAQRSQVLQRNQRIALRINRLQLTVCLHQVLDRVIDIGIGSIHLCLHATNHIVVAACATSGLLRSRGSSVGGRCLCRTAGLRGRRTVRSVLDCLALRSHWQSSSRSRRAGRYHR